MQAGNYTAQSWVMNMLEKSALAAGGPTGWRVDVLKEKEKKTAVFLYIVWSALNVAFSNGLKEHVCVLSCDCLFSQRSGGLF